MQHNYFLNEDLEKFAQHIGFDGIDSDMFYESYYGIDEDYDEEDWESHYTNERFISY